MNERNDLPTEENNPSVEDSLSHFWGTAQDVIERYTHCVICGANLHFIHVTNFAHNVTQETAKCPECGVKARQIVHRLQ